MDTTDLLVTSLVKHIQKGVMVSRKEDMNVEKNLHPGCYYQWYM